MDRTPACRVLAQTVWKREKSWDDAIASLLASSGCHTSAKVVASFLVVVLQEKLAVKGCVVVLTTT
jgi:HD-GYP domain-containing protein (c-di-GMP phosphodiesterase class II)